MKDYEIIKPFTILDIYSNLDFSNTKHKEFFKSLLLDGADPDDIYESCDDLWYESFKNNLSILEEIGLIKEKDTILIPGMKLESEKGYIYHIVKSGDGYQWNRISLYCEGHDECDYGFIWNYGKSYRNKTTLNELNKEEDAYFKVIND